MPSQSQQQQRGRSAVEANHESSVREVSDGVCGLVCGGVWGVLVGVVTTIMTTDYNCLSKLYT